MQCDAIYIYMDRPYGREERIGRMRTISTEKSGRVGSAGRKSLKAADRFLSHNGVRLLLALGLFVGTSIGCHWIFMAQFRGFSSSPMFFGWPGYDTTSQMLSAKSLLEQSLLNGDMFWSWSYGLGGDIFSEFSYYYSTSPFFYVEFLVKALFGAAGAGIYVQQQWTLVFSVVKQAAVMTVMYLLCRVEKKETAVSMIAGLVYGCSQWYLMNAFTFGYMTDAMFWLPLAAIALHSFREKGKWMPLVWVVALTAANSFYFGYMSCLFYAVFFLIFSADRGMKFRQYLLCVLKLAGIAAAGLLLSCVCFLPSVHALLSADRVQTLFESRVIPSPSFFITLPEQLFTRVGQFAFPAILLFVVLLRFRACPSLCRKKTVLALFWLAAWTVPMVSSIMNGFSYASDRWLYIVIFAVAYAVPDWLEAIQVQKPVSLKALFIGCSAIIVFYSTRIVRGLNIHELNDRRVMILSVAMLVLVYVIQVRPVRIPPLPRMAIRRCGKAALIGCMALCYVLTSITAYRNLGHCGIFPLDDEKKQSYLVGDETQRTINAELVPSSEEFYRVDDASIYQTQERYENRSCLHRNYSISAYNSMINRELHQWIKRTYDVASLFDSPSYYRGFGHRLFLENAWGVEYKINGETLPYGYEYETLESGNTVMHNTLGVGLDLWYDTVLTQEVFDRLDYAERDTALLQTAVIGDGAAGSYPSAQLDDTTAYYPLDLSEGTFSNCRLEDGKLIAGDDAVLHLPLPEISGPGEFLLTFRIREQGDSRYTISVDGNQVIRFESEYKWGFETEEFSHVVPGDAENIEMSLTKGTYVIEDMRLAFNSYDRLESWTQDRNRYNLENRTVSGSRVEGTLRNETAGILTLSMPYNEGWSCTVDGKSTPLIRVNGVFTGIELEPGEHVIKLHFTPPYLVMGACVSGAVLLAMLLIAVCPPAVRRLRRRGGKGKSIGGAPAPLPEEKIVDQP